VAVLRALTVRIELRGDYPNMRKGAKLLREQRGGGDLLDRAERL
jgi:hypothetical protein